jgi:alkaline phosphatase D
MQRRELFAALAGAGLSGGIVRAANSDQPLAIQAGDVVPGRAILWTRGASPGDWTIRWRAGASGSQQTLRGPALTAATDFTGRVELTGLPASAQIQYEVELPGSPTSKLTGTFRTAPGPGSDIRFLWSADMVGQGWGINPDIGGIRIFDVMRKLEPHFFLNSGDSIYADSPIPSDVIKLPDGRTWKNIVTEEKSKVAETLDEFRGCYRYNLLDRNVQEFSANVAQIWQWDDHEFTNNWSPSKDLTADARYKEKNIRTLLGRARQAFLEYAPLRRIPDRIYRKIPYGPLLDVFVIDMRTYRGPNTHNRQTAPSAETVFLGKPQLDWLLKDLRASKATWKVIAADMPLGLNVADGKDREGRPQFEASSNGDNGPALGRELEIAGLLKAIKQHRIRNTVWLTADVHYTAAHYYDPAKAQFTDFDPFHEFVSGPLNAGTFGPGQLDNTFGPQVLFSKAPPKGQSNLSPLSGMQFFGDVAIDAKTREMKVTLRDLTGAGIYSKTLEPKLG